MPAMQMSYWRFSTRAASSVRAMEFLKMLSNAPSATGGAIVQRRAAEYRRWLRAKPDIFPVRALRRGISTRSPDCAASSTAAWIMAASSSRCAYALGFRLIDISSVVKAGRVTRPAQHALCVVGVVKVVGLFGKLLATNRIPCFHHFVKCFDGLCARDDVHKGFIGQFVQFRLVIRGGRQGGSNVYR